MIKSVDEVIKPRDLIKRLEGPARDQVKEIIIEVLYRHVGFENRVDREFLNYEIRYGWARRYSGSSIVLGDRTMRNLIEELRAGSILGSRICATTEERGGYYIARRRRELLESLRPDRNRALAIWLRMKMQRKNSIKAFACDSFQALQQISLFERDKYAG